MYSGHKDLGQCRICGSGNTEFLISFGQQPSSCDLPLNPSGECRTYDLSLGHCTACGYVFITAPIPPEAIYSNGYWPTSSNPPEHAHWLVETVTARYTSDTSDFILDVGSNDGFLLRLIRELGYTNLLGVEPSKQCASLAEQKGVSTINRYFDAKSAQQIKSKYGRPKMIICRQVVEHVLDPNAFIAEMRGLMSRDSILVLEFPSFEITARKGDISTIWEQHVSYFTLESMSLLLAQHDLQVIHHNYLEHGGGSLFLVAGPGRGNVPKRCASSIAEMFKKTALCNLAIANDLFKKLCSGGGKVTAWGAGSRGISFLNFSDTARFVDFIIDDDPNKAGRYLAKSGIPIHSSDRLHEEMPRYCVILPLRSKKIEHRLMINHAHYEQNGGAFIELFPGDMFYAPLVEEKYIQTNQSGVVAPISANMEW
ncbi:MAG: class I SAM-dependent methyltransferase [Pseudomonadota bacterium]